MIITIIVVIIALVSIPAVIAMFTSDKYTLARSIIIHKPTPDVFNYIRLNRNQHEYSKWLSLDPDTEIGFKGAPDGTAGAILTFSSQHKKAGTGEWEITRLVDDQRIEFELRFLKPFQFTANGHFETEPVSINQTKVTWVYNGGMNWPMNFMLLFLNMDKLVGNDIQTSLENMKLKVEGYDTENQDPMAHHFASTKLM